MEEADMEVMPDLGEMTDLQMEDQMLADMMVEADQETLVPDQMIPEVMPDAMMAEEMTAQPSEGCAHSHSPVQFLSLWLLMLIWGGRRLFLVPRAEP